LHLKWREFVDSKFAAIACSTKTSSQVRFGKKHIQICLPWYVGSELNMAPKDEHHAPQHAQRLRPEDFQSIN
jgi:hypothetical protein